MAVGESPKLPTAEIPSVRALRVDMCHTTITMVMGCCGRTSAEDFHTAQWTLATLAIVHNMFPEDESNA